MQNILLYTATGAHNLGDEHILAEEVRYLLTKYPEVRISIATYDREFTTQMFGILLGGPGQQLEFIPYFPYALRSRPLQNIYYLWRNVVAIFQADLVIIGGGGLFYDSEKGQDFSSQKWGWGIRLFLIQFFRKRLFYWSIGIDLTLPHLRGVSWWFTYSRSTVSVREGYSQSLLSTIGVKAICIADPVFLYAPRVSELISLNKLSDSTQAHTRGRVGISLRPGYLDEPTIISLVRGLQSRRFEVVFLTHSTHPTNIETSDLFYAPLANSLGVAIAYTIIETELLYPTLTAVVSMRLHASILAVDYGLPFYAISYGHKTRAILEELELSYVQDADSFHLGRFFADFERLLDERLNAVLAIKTKSTTIRTNISNTLDRVFSHF